MGVARRGLDTPPAGGPAQSLLIVARDHPDLYRALEQAFGASQRVSVLLDRRQSERRRAVRAVDADLRRSERRSLTRMEEDVRVRKYVLVRPHYRRPQD